MQVTATRAALAEAVALLAIAAVPGGAAAGVEEQGASYTINYFSDTDGIHVTTHHWDYDVELESGATLDLNLALDTVVIPAVDAPRGSPEAVDAITSASRPITGNAAYSDFVKVRRVAQASVSARGADVAYYVSDEADYFAQMLSVGANRDVLDRNLNIAARVSYGWDRIEPLPDDDGTAVLDYQRTRNASLTATRIVTPTLVVRLGAEVARVSGRQHDPYRLVYVDGDYVPEAHPSGRTRHDLFVQARKYLTNRSSLRLDYRLYGDDWGVRSHTVGGRIHQRVGEHAIARYRYRYYTQSDADFWRDRYLEPGGVDGLRTGDYRLGAFAAHLFGAKLSWDLGRGPLPVRALRGIHFSVAWDQYFNSNGFGANIVESGVSATF